MDTRSDQEDDDDDFSDLYKEYTGPPVLNKSFQETPMTNKRSLSGSDEEEEDPDPNAVPTDFTSRDKKAWDAKSKATERNWKKRKEEEMICKLCGDSGHYTQGCPSTLGANGKEFFQRIAARDKHVRALFTGKVMADIEMEIGCKLRLDEKFLFVSGKDRLILAKGVDAVHKLMHNDGSRNVVSNSTIPQSKSPDMGPTDSRITQSDSQKSFSSPRNVSRSQPKNSKHEKAMKDPVREDPQKGFSHPKTSRSKSPDRSSTDVRFARNDSCKSNSSPRKATQVQPRFNKHDKATEEGLREDLQRMSKDSPQVLWTAKCVDSSTMGPPVKYCNLEEHVFTCLYGWVASCGFVNVHNIRGVAPTQCLTCSSFDEAYGSNGARGPSSHSKSPLNHVYSGNSFSMHGSHNQDIAACKTTERDTGRLRSVIMPPTKVENPEFSRALKELELELEFKTEAADLSFIRDKEEDEENLRHREAIWGIRESYIKKLSSLRSAHTKQWEEFLQHDAQRRKQQLDSQRQTERWDARPITSGYDGGGSKQASFGKYGAGSASSANRQYTGSSYPMEANQRYTDPPDNYVPSRVNDIFGEYHRQRREDFGRNYNRY